MDSRQHQESSRKNLAYVLSQNHFKPLKYDFNVFRNDYIINLIYVDDFMITSSSLSQVDYTIDIFTKVFKIKNLGQMTNFW